ncbi:hypothetical protein QUF72_16655 [Desulfobacterales bacterium HSG2]|nr:hypothetical protein [Desulfobacterales bacterium HSG2]
MEKCEPLSAFMKDASLYPFMLLAGLTNPTARICQSEPSEGYELAKLL